MSKGHCGVVVSTVKRRAPPRIPPAGKLCIAYKLSWQESYLWLSGPTLLQSGDVWAALLLVYAKPMALPYNYNALVTRSFLECCSLRGLLLIAASRQG